MADRNLNINVRANVEGARKEFQKVEQSNNQFKKSLDGTGKSLTAVGGLLGKVFAAGMAIKIGRDWVNAFMVQEKAIAQLTNALGKHSKALIDNANHMQKNLAVSNEAVIQAQARLAAFIKEEEQIIKVTKAVADFAAAKGYDLVSASDLFAKSIGSSTNALTRYGIEAKGAAGSAQRLNSIVDNTSKLFGGAAAASADTLAGKIEKLKNAFSDFGKEVVGETIGIVEGLGSMFGWASDKVEELLKYLDIIEEKKIPKKTLLLEMPKNMNEAMERAFEQYKRNIGQIERAFDPSTKTKPEIEAEINRLKEANELLLVTSKDYINNLRQIERLGKIIAPDISPKFDLKELQETRQQIAQELKWALEDFANDKDAIEEALTGDIELPSFRLASEQELQRFRIDLIEDYYEREKELINLQSQVLMDNFVDDNRAKTLIEANRIRQINELERQQIEERFSLLRNLSNEWSEILAKEGMDAFNKIFGEANSLLEKFIQATIREIASLGAKKLGASIFNTILSFIPGGSLVTGFTGGVGGNTGGEGRQQQPQNITLQVDSNVMMRAVVYPNYADMMAELTRRGIA
jgi:2-hydroxy-3-keto-5-methylthiopentenyl-1-phosphate phosphatase